LLLFSLLKTKKQAMVLSKTYKKGYLRGSSLVESVVSISLIAICLLIALKIYSNVLDQSIKTNNLETRIFIDSKVAEMKLNKKFEPETYSYKMYSIQKTISEQNENPNLLKVTFSVLKPSGTLNYHYLILRSENEK